MVVGPGITRTCVPPITWVENWFPPGAGPPVMEFIVAPVEVGGGLEWLSGGGDCAGAAVALVFVSPNRPSGGPGVATTFGITYTVAELVRPPPAGIATVEDSGEMVVEWVSRGHSPNRIDGPPGKQAFKPGYWALYAGFWIRKSSKVWGMYPYCAGLLPLWHRGVGCRAPVSPHGG